MDTAQFWDYPVPQTGRRQSITTPPLYYPQDPLDARDRCMYTGHPTSSAHSSTLYMPGHSLATPPTFQAPLPRLDNLSFMDALTFGETPLSQAATPSTAAPFFSVPQMANYTGLTELQAAVRSGLRDGASEEAILSLVQEEILAWSQYAQLNCLPQLTCYRRRSTSQCRSARARLARTIRAPHRQGRILRTRHEGQGQGFAKGRA